MPIYEYRCKECGHEMRFLEKSGSRKKHRCEECGGDEVEKRFSTFAPQAEGTKEECPGCPMGGCEIAREKGPGGCMA